MLRHVCPSVCPRETTRLSLDRFSLKSTCMYGIFTNVCILEGRLKWDESKVRTFMLNFRVLRDK
jgi:hypothetical protein